MTGVQTCALPISIISSAAAAIKPVMTESEIKRFIPPSLKRPKISWIRPTSKVRVNKASILTSPFRFRSALPVTNASAFVRLIIISEELEVNEPTIVFNMPEYKP